jgi:hypothetical protein
MSWFRKKPEPPQLRFRLYLFKPTPNISAYELATIIGNTWSPTPGVTLADGLHIPAEVTAEEYFRDGYGMPELSRHFEATDRFDEYPASWF